MASVSPRPSVTLFGGPFASHPTVAGRHSAASKGGVEAVSRRGSGRGASPAPLRLGVTGRDVHQLESDVSGRPWRDWWEFYSESKSSVAQWPADVRPFRATLGLCGEHSDGAKVRFFLVLEAGPGTLRGQGAALPPTRVSPDALRSTAEARPFAGLLPAAGDDTRWRSRDDRVAVDVTPPPQGGCRTDCRGGTIRSRQHTSDKSISRDLTRI